MPIPTSTAVALVAVALLLLAQPGLGVPASPPAVVPDSINGESNTVIAGESWGVDVAMVWPAGVGVGDVVFWEVVADDADAGGARPRNGSFCALNVGLGDCGSADAAAELRTSIHVTLDDQQRGAPMYRLRLSWDEGLPAGDSTSVSEPFRLFIVPGAVTLLPVVITVITAVWTKDVILSLYAGVYFASLLTTNYNPFDAFVRSLDTYILGSIVDSDHATILLFTWLIAGMIACMIKAGGGGGLVLALSRHAKTPRGGSFLVACLSFMIFFDDYANTLIVGQTMRPIADTLLISREKLAFIVDGIAAPITSISPISSWVGFELSLIENAVENLNIPDDVKCYERSPFLIFVETIPYRFYPVYLLALQLALIATGRELGPMLRAERKARAGRVWTATSAMEREDEESSLLPTGTANPPGALNDEVGILDKMWPSPQTPLRWWNGVIPIATVVFGVLIALVLSGIAQCTDDGITDPSITDIFGNSDSMRSLLYASAVGTIVTFIMVWLQRVNHAGDIEIRRPCRWTTPKHGDTKPLLSLAQLKEAWVQGMGNIMDAALTLILAWAIGDAFTECQTGTYISLALKQSIPKGLFPTLTFGLASILSLVTGTSWGTMAILFPIVTPAVHAAAPCDAVLFSGTIAGILAGAVFGDHCSPISDTTLLASIACQCPLPAHVITQAPYAVLTGIAAVLFGTLPVGFFPVEYPAWLGLLLGLFMVCTCIPLLGARVDGDDDDKLTMLVHSIRRSLRECYMSMRKRQRGASPRY